MEGEVVSSSLTWDLAPSVALQQSLLVRENKVRVVGWCYLPAFISTTGQTDKTGQSGQSNSIELITLLMIQLFL